MKSKSNLIILVTGVDVKGQPGLVALAVRTGKKFEHYGYLEPGAQKDAKSAEFQAWLDSFGGSFTFLEPDRGEAAHFFRFNLNMRDYMSESSKGHHTVCMRSYAEALSISICEDSASKPMTLLDRARLLRAQWKLIQDTRTRMLKLGKTLKEIQSMIDAGASKGGIRQERGDSPSGFRRR